MLIEREGHDHKHLCHHVLLRSSMPGRGLLRALRLLGEVCAQELELFEYVHAHGQFGSVRVPGLERAQYLLVLELRDELLVIRVPDIRAIHEGDIDYLPDEAGQSLAASSLMNQAVEAKVLLDQLSNIAAGLQLCEAGAAAGEGFHLIGLYPLGG